MKLSEEQMIELMQHADGELDADGLARVKTLLAENAEARTFLKELGVLGSFVQEAEPLTVLPIETVDLTDAIMAKVDALESAPATTTPARVTSLDAAREKRRRVGVFVATAIALAAGIALVMRTHPNEDRPSALNAPQNKPNVSAPIAHAPELPPASSEASQQVANAATDKSGEPGIEVNVSDSPQSGFSVFYLPASGAASASAVVWIDESSGGNR